MDKIEKVKTEVRMLSALLREAKRNHDQGAVSILSEAINSLNEYIELLEKIND